jgi:hypothetical protein
MIINMAKIILFDIKIGKKIGKAKNLIPAKPLTEIRRTRDRRNKELSRR